MRDFTYFFLYMLTRSLGAYKTKKGRTSKNGLKNRSNESKKKEANDCFARKVNKWEETKRSK